MRVYQRNRSPVLSRRETKYATKYMASLIMSRQLLKNLTIYVEFIENCVDRETRKQIQGDCLWLDDNISPREFKIRINSSIKWKSRQLMTLGHELTHVRQYAMGEMKDLVRGPFGTKWKMDYIHEHKMDYWDLPWEIEAHGRETGLLIRYREHIKKEGIIFE